MMVFTSVYGVVDGFFISNFAGKTAFAAINVIMPVTMILGAFGFMIGTGGTAIVSKTLGEGDKERANNYFSFLVYATVVIGIIISVIAIIFLPKIATLLGIDEEMAPYAVIYGRIIIGFTPFFMLQNLFQSFFITAERPALGFKVTFISGCTNMILDALFVWVLRFGVTGAAVATGISQLVGSTIPLLYFVSKRNDSILRLGKGNFNFKVLLKTCTNGWSELVSNISGSIVSIVFNFQLLKLAGQNGVSAYGVMMYVNFIYVAIFIGYVIGTAPIIGYNYGAQNFACLCPIRSYFKNFRWLRRGTLRDDQKRFQNILLFLFICRLRYFRVIDVYGARQRRSVGNHFLFKNFGISDFMRAYLTRIFRRKRHLDFNDDCRNFIYRSYCDIRNSKTQKVRIFLNFIFI